jgi:hypothetical protein
MNLISIKLVPDNTNIKGALHNMFKHRTEDSLEMALMILIIFHSFITVLNNTQQPTCTGKYSMVSGSLSSFTIHTTDKIKFIRV